MIPAKLQDDVIHHSANAAAVVIPPLAVFASDIHNIIVTVLAYTPGMLGAVWYSILIFEKITDHLQKRRNRE